MKFKLLPAVLALAGVAASGAASAAIVGGVNFGAFGTHIETTTVAETFINGNNQLIKGYGVVSTVNGSNAYTGDASQLFFTFNYMSQNFSGSNVEFKNGTVNIYKGTLANLLTQSSDTNYATIQGMSEWVRLTGHANLGGLATPTAELYAFGALSGNSLTFNGTGLLDVDTSNAFGLASVRSFLDSNTVIDAIGGLSDIIQTTTGNNFVLNSFDNTTGCDNGTAAAGTAASAGQWCIAGSTSLRGKVVPEPASLALVGLGLIGLVASRARKSA